jgi:acetyltransferase-like isoleucine patch superfamily enzyme
MILRLIQGAASRARALMYRLLGVRIEGACWLRAIEIPRHHRAIRIGVEVALDRGTVLLISGEANGQEKIVIGRASYVNRCTMIDASERIEIGESCMIGPFCYITDHDHVFEAGVDPAAGELVAAPTRIGDRCWLGAHVTVLKGVTIGEGSVIGAGSVVTKSVPANAVAVGNPARVIKTLST